MMKLILLILMAVATLIKSKSGPTEQSKELHGTLLQIPRASSNAIFGGTAIHVLHVSEEHKSNYAIRCMHLAPTGGQGKGNSYGDVIACQDATDGLTSSGSNEQQSIISSRGS